jgi:hypothetical protein
MAHRDTVADGYGIELEGHAACLTDGLLDNFCHLVEMDVAGNYLAETIDDADKGFVDVGVTYAAGVKQPPVRRPLKTRFYCITSHFVFLSTKITA